MPHPRPKKEICFHETEIIQTLAISVHRILSHTETLCHHLIMRTFGALSKQELA